MAKRAFGELELQILHILKMSKRMTIKEVHQTLGGTDNYNTIMTVMNRLTKKKQLARERCGLQFEYWICERTSIPSLFAKFKEKLFGVKTAMMVSYLLESAEDLTDEDFAEMEKILEKTKNTRQSGR